MTNGVHIRDGDGYYRYSGSCAVRTHSLQPTTLTKDTLLVISYSNRAPYSEQEQHYHTIDTQTTTHSIHYCQTTNTQVDNLQKLTAAAAAAPPTI